MLIGLMAFPPEFAPEARCRLPKAFAYEALQIKKMSL
jgi:hypothetical protein